MLLRFKFNGDENLIYIPDTMPWRMIYKEFDENCNDECNVYLLMNGETIEVSNSDEFCMEHRIPEYEFGYLYADVVEEVKKLLLASEGKNQCVDLEEIKGRLLKEKYFEQWKNKGYISPYEHEIW